MNLDFLYGYLNLSFWGYVLATIIMVQVSIFGVTVYLHRDAAHRSLDLHPAIRHFFRLWIWMSSSMLTKEWVAVHRKHHAKCETAEDPHSPVIYGLKKVLAEGAELYQVQARDKETLEKYGRGCPDDWVERNVYSKYRNAGIISMALLDAFFFGVPAILIFAIQMLTFPVLAAGVINGLGHYFGYRNFECPDASTNVAPWGLIIGGEELHNNHHSFPSSAKFSIQPWEVDAGWGLISVFKFFGLAKVHRTAPKPVKVEGKHVDLETVRAVIVNRMHVVRDYTRKVMLPVFRAELAMAGSKLSAGVRKLLVRESSLLDEHAKSRLTQALEHSKALHTVHEFRTKLQLLWNSNMSNDKLLVHLKEWIAQAEASGIKSLQDFAASLRSYSMPALAAA
ncbi:MAG: fatty acid desaturase [Steroidobacteraceae bacterium]